MSFLSLPLLSSMPSNGLDALRRPVYAIHVRSVCRSFIEEAVSRQLAQVRKSVFMMGCSCRGGIVRHRQHVRSGPCRIRSAELSSALTFFLRSAREQETARP